MNKKQIVNAIVGIIAGLSGVASIITGVIAAKDDRETLYEDIEERYDLVPKEK